ncbi:MAG: hypothetical protein J5654_09360 [Victivallales bacterium]|nr:hypothetical protein [Victivallales bacterium]
MNFSRPELKQRLLSPRIVIYVVLLLVAAWWINRLDKTRQNTTIPQAPSSEEILSATSGDESHLPLMVVISLPDEGVREVVAESQSRYSDVCRIVLLSTGTDADGVKEVFQVKELPVALLFDNENQELARMQGAITDELLSELVGKCPKYE